MQVVLSRSGKFSIDKNPFTPKASLIRYWSQSIKSNAPQSEFLLSKASPMTAIESASFAKLAKQNKLSTQLPQFCSAAKLLCFPDLSPSLEKHSPESSFSGYSNQNFTNYGTGGRGRENNFKKYATDVFGSPFKQYSRNSKDQDVTFSTYTENGPIPDQSFNSYAKKAEGGHSNFNNYQDSVNVPDLNFNSYGADSISRKQSFKSYTNNSGSNTEVFTSYGTDAHQEVSEFKSYADNAQFMESDFANYADKGTAANETFTSYGSHGDIEYQHFKNYGEKGKSVTHSFTSYHAEPLDNGYGFNTFDSYGKESNSANENFINYKGNSSIGSSTFTGYGQGSTRKKVGFQIYSPNDIFKEYQDKHTISFATYNQGPPYPTASSSPSPNQVAKVNKRVESGKFYRESMLKQGNVMPMPDIRDKMPKRPFLPRSILSKLPFSSGRLDEMKKIFHAGDDSSMEKMMLDSLDECERAPSVGETKRCAGSAEDMIDFATSVLGHNVVVRTTENTHGYNKDIMIGSVKGINDGKVTKSVSCHQSLYPYLLYYCHSVPKVKVYDAEILDLKTKAKVNQGTAICHMDTSSWSPTHGAFLALGSSPGKIEVCHWIFENDMTWTIADN
ncbi:hypothetical protein ACFE04_023634 [Oxalis oulophora]